MKEKIVYCVESVKYEAEDGREFTREKDCVLYEKYSQIPTQELLSPYLNFEEWGDRPWQIDFNLCVVFDNVPNEIIDFIALMDYPRYSSFASCLRNNVYYDEPRLFYYNCADLYNGGSHAAWEEIGTSSSISRQIERLTAYKESLEKLSKRG